MYHARIIVAAVLASAAPIRADSSAQAIAGYPFDNHGGGASAATPAGTGLTVYASGTLFDFARSDRTAIHAVRRGTGNHAAMPHDGDRPAQADGIATDTGVAADMTGQPYRVSSLSAPGDHDDPSQATRAGDAPLPRLPDDTGASVASFTPAPATTDLTAGSFGYIGGGTGAVRRAASRIGSEIDDVAIAATPEPAAWAMMIAGVGAMGIAARRSRVRVSYVA